MQSSERGTYECLKRIEALENDVEAAAKYVQACKDLRARGIKFEGQEFVHDNMMTLRTEYLYLKTEYRWRVADRRRVSGELGAVADWNRDAARVV